MFISSTQRWICLCSVCLSLFCMAQNEEVLKKCAQEYLARVKQEEQRYQTLKVHAEEKLDKYVVVVVVTERKCGVRQTKYFPFECSWWIWRCASRRANEDIAQVRAKANSDGTALTASLRKEQMKNDSLEQALQQKVPDTSFVCFFGPVPTSSDFPKIDASSLVPPSEPRDRGAHQDLRRADRQNGENRLSDLLQRSHPPPTAPPPPTWRRRHVHAAALRLSVTPAPPRLLMYKKDASHFLCLANLHY